jgi:hypothetical protein
VLGGMVEEDAHRNQRHGGISGRGKGGRKRGDTTRKKPIIRQTGAW